MALTHLARSGIELPGQVKIKSLQCHPSHLEDSVEAFLVGNGEILLQVGWKRFRHQTQKSLNLCKYFGFLQQKYFKVWQSDIWKPQLELRGNELMGYDFATSPATPSPSATVVIASTYKLLAMMRLNIMRFRIYGNVSEDSRW